MRAQKKGQNVLLAFEDEACELDSVTMTVKPFNLHMLQKLRIIILLGKLNHLLDLQ